MVLSIKVTVEVEIDMVTIDVGTRDTTTNSITASATQTQAGAVGLTTTYNEITVSVTSGDAVRLPAAVEGLVIHIVNKADNSITVFPASGDSLDGGSVDAGVTLLGFDRMITYVASNDTDWVSYPG